MTTSNPGHPAAGHPPALQLYTVREQLAAGRAGILNRIAGFGYAAVEPFGILDDPAGLAADLAAAGLAVCSVHATPAGDQAGPVAAAARVLGTDTVIVPYLPPERFADLDGVRSVAAELNAMAARLGDEGLRLGYHNHDHELALRPGGTPALEVLAAWLDPAVVLEVDTYWAAVGGQDVPALLGRLGGRVGYLHVKDGPVTKDDPMTAVGAGRMPVAEILAAAPPAAWRVVELDRCATDMMTAVADSLAWLAAEAPGPRGPAVSAPVGVAVVGCGTISDEYLRNLTSFPDLHVLICADLDLERAKAQAARYGVAGAGSTVQAMAHPDVELVVNLTIPAAHAAVAPEAVTAGKHVWNEKPLALDTSAGCGLLAAAAAAGVRVGCAPDTVLGAGLQTARRLIASGAIGEPRSALALMQDPGPERWHHDPGVPVPARRGPAVRHGAVLPETLATLFGPAEQVAALGRRSQRQPGHRHRPAGRDRVRGRGADPRGGADRVRAGPGRDDRAQLRLAAAAARLRGDHRHRGDAVAARPQPVRRRHPGPRDRPRRLGDGPGGRGDRGPGPRRAGHGPRHPGRDAAPGVR